MLFNKLEFTNFIAKSIPMSKISVAILLLSILLIGGCKKDENSNIPLVTVNFYINVNNPAYNNVSVPGGWMYLNGGSRGIILYRASNDLFKAYDRHCTYNSTSSCALVSVDASNITGTDDCCGSKFLIVDGSVTQSPASLPLKQYQTSFDGSVLHIHN
jgi:nitrite reductase/ring-hydroxylating ferredoxin subunit